MAEVILDQVTKIYPGGTKAVDRMTLAIEDREFMVLVGPSGCGKSTMLRMIAGLEVITEGTVTIGGRVVNDLPPKDRDIAMVFQNYALFPHMSVFGNISFGLKLRKMPKDEIRSKVDAVAQQLGIGDLLGRRPKALSGGQRQRVALGRAIVRNPAAFLLDEPLSNLDAKMRTAMRKELNLLHQRLQATMIYVTHDQIEAMTLGDRMCVMNDGRAQQVGVPLDIYDHPVNRFVAGFIGTPAMNFFQGRIVDDRGLRFRAEGMDLPLREDLAAAVREHGGDGEVTYGFRPETARIQAVDQAGDEEVAFRGEVEVVEKLGDEQIVYCTVGGVSFTVKTDAHYEVREGGAYAFVVNPSRAHLFIGADGANLAAGRTPA